MAEVVQNAEHDFWRAPAAGPVVEQPGPMLVETCPKCGSEFVMGAGFCHVCGGARHTPAAVVSQNWTRYLQFHFITAQFQGVRERMALPTASLVAFLIGIGCAVCAISVGLVFSVATILDWQAIQLYRVEWLLGCAAAFLAGILLKTSTAK
jgi:hypothetical protein